MVLARNEHKPGRPTVLFYGHYDVQPPEPLEQWTTPAFEPTVRDDGTGHQAVYARGAVDDKGQVWCHVEAVRAWQQHGGLPVNLTMLIEGEEECGSNNLEPFIRSNANELKADVCVVSDTGMLDVDRPAITYMLRGIVYVDRMRDRLAGGGDALDGHALPARLRYQIKLDVGRRRNQSRAPVGSARLARGGGQRGCQQVGCPLRPAGSGGGVAHQLGEVGTVLAGDPGDERARHGVLPWEASRDS